MIEDRGVWVELTRSELYEACRIGEQRALLACLQGRADRHGRKESIFGGPEDHMVGTVTEIAVAKFTNLFWSFAVGVTDSRDVGGWIDVRGRRGDDDDKACRDCPAREPVRPWYAKDMRIYPGDPDATPVVHGVVRNDDLRLWTDDDGIVHRVWLGGWIYAGDGKRPEYWRTYYGRSMFYVPPDQLNPMAELLDLVALRRFTPRAPGGDENVIDLFSKGTKS
jgi:hypothetical protein